MRVKYISETEVCNLNGSMLLHQDQFKPITSIAVELDWIIKCKYY